MGGPQAPQPFPSYGAQGHAPYNYQHAYPPSGMDAGWMSPKRRNVVILLCFFVGFLGIHRFYLGKIGTGILMIFTLGGFGIWSLVDFFISIFGNYTDSNGRYVDKGYSVPMVVIMIVFMVLSFITNLVSIARLFNEGVGF
jgi:TM2 domain-containing membrane protein YozV